MSRSTISKGPLGPDTCTERMYHYDLRDIYGIWSTDRFHELIETFKFRDVRRQISHQKATISLVVMEVDHLFVLHALA